MGFYSRIIFYTFSAIFIFLNVMKSEGAAIDVTVGYGDQPDKDKRSINFHNNYHGNARGNGTVNSGLINSIVSRLTPKLSTMQNAEGSDVLVGNNGIPVIGSNGAGESSYLSAPTFTMCFFCSQNIVNKLYQRSNSTEKSTGLEDRIQNKGKFALLQPQTKTRIKKLLVDGTRTFSELLRRSFIETPTVELVENQLAN